MLSATAADIISVRRAAVPEDMSSVAFTLHCPAGLSLEKQTHYPHWLPYRQEEGGDGEQEVMIHSVQVKLAPLITPLIWSAAVSNDPSFFSFTRSTYELLRDWRGSLVNYK